MHGQGLEGNVQSSVEKKYVVIGFIGFYLFVCLLFCQDDNAPARTAWTTRTKLDDNVTSSRPDQVAAAAPGLTFIKKSGTK